MEAPSGEKRGTLSAPEVSRVSPRVATSMIQIPPPPGRTALKAMRRPSGETAGATSWFPYDTGATRSEPLVGLIEPLPERKAATTAAITSVAVTIRAVGRGALGPAEPFPAVAAIP